MRRIFPLALALLAAAAPETGLEEMKLRGIVAKDAASWTEDEAATLRRLRSAERRGALEFLNDRLGTLSGVTAQVDKGRGYKKPFLTVAGYERWSFILSQEARSYFESKGADAGAVFQMTDIEGKRIFTDAGVLTDDGAGLYSAARAKKPVFWRNTDGRVTGTVRPPANLLVPKAAGPAPAPAPAPKAPVGQMPQAGPIAPPGGAPAASASPKAKPATKKSP